MPAGADGSAPIALLWRGGYCASKAESPPRRWCPPAPRSRPGISWLNSSCRTIPSRPHICDTLPPELGTLEIRRASFATLRCDEHKTSLRFRIDESGTAP
jgi:hypothetical protein